MIIIILFYSKDNKKIINMKIITRIIIILEKNSAYVQNEQPFVSRDKLIKTKKK